MAKRKQASGGQKKKKPVTIEFIKDEPNSTPHIVLHEMIERHYPELEDAKIGLFWKYGWKAEADSGRIRLWQVAKASETLRAVTEAPRVLVVLSREDEAGWLSLRNVPEVHLLAADQLNTYDVLVSDEVVFTKDALAEFLGRGTGEASA